MYILCVRIFIYIVYRYIRLQTAGDTPGVSDAAVCARDSQAYLNVVCGVLCRGSGGAVGAHLTKTCEK